MDSIEAPIGTTEPDETPTTEPPSLPTRPEAGALTLSSFFQPEGWDENQFDVANIKQVDGIGAELPSCGDSKFLELRLGSSFKLLSFSVGQSQDSYSSGETLVVRVIGDGTQLAIKKVPFSRVQAIKVNVSDVSAAKIEVQSDLSDSCESTKAVIFKGMLD